MSNNERAAILEELIAFTIRSSEIGVTHGDLLSVLIRRYINLPIDKD